VSAGPEAIVIGGGLLGCASAAALAEGGARTLLVEREDLASGSSAPPNPRWGRRSSAGRSARRTFQVDPWQLTFAFARLARRRGATVRCGAEVVGLLREGEGILGVRLREGNVYAGAVVVAAGAWTAPLLEGAGLWAGAA